MTISAVRSFLTANRVVVSIVASHDVDAVQNDLSRTSNVLSYDEAPQFAYRDEVAEFSVVVSNNGVGHHFPGGTTDLNEAWVFFEIRDASGAIVYQKVS